VANFKLSKLVPDAQSHASGVVVLLQSNLEVDGSHLALLATLEIERHLLALVKAAEAGWMKP
jgi:hypothetical protein